MLNMDERWNDVALCDAESLHVSFLQHLSIPGPVTTVCTSLPLDIDISWGHMLITVMYAGWVMPSRRIFYILVIFTIR